jgi:hypothetical protein
MVGCGGSPRVYFDYPPGHSSSLSIGDEDGLPPREVNPEKLERVRNHELLPSA